MWREVANQSSENNIQLPSSEQGQSIDHKLMLSMPEESLSD